jgi:hypothetical protein
MSEQINLFKGDTLSTVLLIVVVFFVFYYLTKPKSDRECFSGNIPIKTWDTDEPVPILQSNYDLYNLDLYKLIYKPMKKKNKENK